MIIKLFLIGSAVVVCAWVLRGGRRGSTLAFTRLSGLALAAGWIVAVLFPDAVTTVAQSVGVGRGADLVLYVSVVGVLFSTLLQRRRTRDLEASLAALTRAQAILEQRVAAADTDRPAVH